VGVDLAISKLQHLSAIRKARDHQHTVQEQLQGKRPQLPPRLLPHF
jgi:hypothetical protein